MYIVFCSWTTNLQFYCCADAGLRVIVEENQIKRKKKIRKIKQKHKILLLCCVVVLCLRELVDHVMGCHQACVTHFLLLPT